MTDMWLFKKLLFFNLIFLNIVYVVCFGFVLSDESNAADKAISIKTDFRIVKIVPTYIIGFILPEIAALTALTHCKGDHSGGVDFTRNRLFVYIHRILHFVSFAFASIGVVVTFMQDFNKTWPDETKPAYICLVWLRFIQLLIQYIVVACVVRQVMKEEHRRKNYTSSISAYIVNNTIDDKKVKDGHSQECLVCLQNIQDEAFVKLTCQCK